MATITLNIPDAQVQRVINALCANVYEPGTTTPIEPTAANAKAVVIGFVKQTVFNYERRIAEQTVVVDDTIVS